jgi:predicted regulator of Ras-like GTPase activity (Roadblock/LC7/MglB family)
VFAEYLQKVVDHVDGGIGGLIMGLDGIAVERYVSNSANVDMDTIGMEFSFILTQIRKAAELLEVGHVQEICIKAEQLTIVIRMLNEEYFVGVALRADGNFGKCRFLLRTVAPQVLAEL